MLVIAVKHAIRYQEVANQTDRQNVDQKEEVADAQEGEHEYFESLILVLHTLGVQLVALVRLPAPFVENEVSVDLPEYVHQLKPNSY